MIQLNKHKKEYLHLNHIQNFLLLEVSIIKVLNIKGNLQQSYPLQIINQEKVHQKISKHHKKIFVHRQLNDNQIVKVFEYKIWKPHYLPKREDHFNHNLYLIKNKQYYNKCYLQSKKQMLGEKIKNITILKVFINQMN